MPTGNTRLLFYASVQTSILHTGLYNLLAKSIYCLLKVNSYKIRLTVFTTWYTRQKDWLKLAQWKYWLVQGQNEETIFETQYKNCMVKWRSHDKIIKKHEWITHFKYFIYTFCNCAPIFDHCRHPHKPHILKPIANLSSFQCRYYQRLLLFLY